MENSNMKNMIVLKDLPSNIVEEAIVILKTNKKVKNLEKINKITEVEASKKETKDKNYILKEAEMLVNNYISKIEEGKKEKDKNTKKSKFKKYNFIITIIAIVEFIGLLVS